MSVRKARSASRSASLDASSRWPGFKLESEFEADSSLLLGCGSRVSSGVGIFCADAVVLDMAVRASLTCGDNSQV